MELPHLGEHCQEPSCKLLDFLPFRCDSCKKIFCKDHINYFKHSCDKEAQSSKDFQIPLCPLCNNPVPYKRGDLPDHAMSAHIDRDCKSDPAEERRRKIYSNKCSLKGCKQKELIPFTCQKCRLNYCIRHRHEADHDCENIRKTNQSNSAMSSNEINNRRLMFYQSQAAARPPPPPVNPTRMSEKEALEYAIRMSLNEASSNRGQAQNEADLTEDEMLARAIAQSELEHQQRTNSQRGEGADKKEQCLIQ